MVRLLNSRIHSILSILIFATSRLESYSCRETTVSEISNRTGNQKFPISKEACCTKLQSLESNETMNANSTPRESLDEKWSDPSNSDRTNNHQIVWISTIFSKYILNYSVASETNPLCTTHYQIHQHHLRNFTKWAIQMLDSSDLYPNGFFVGDNYKLGNFDECVDVEIPEWIGFESQYCLATFKFNQMADSSKFKLNGSLRTWSDWEKSTWDQNQITGSELGVPRDFFKLAFCIPNSCSSDDLRTSLQALLEDSLKEAGYEINVTVNQRECTTKESISESTGTTVMRTLIAGLSSIALLSTAIDLSLAVMKPDSYNIMTKFSFATSSGFEKWVVPFSVIRNYKTLFSPPKSSEDYQILHGFKICLMICVLIGHRVIAGGLGRALASWKYFENSLYEFSLFYAGTAVTDIFFAISGFLTCTSLWKQLEKNTFNPWAHIVNKLLRTLPAYTFVLACTIYILPWMGNGPLWKTIIEPEVGYCHKNWWTNLLFINNYYKPHDHCIMTWWYMAVDMQLFIMSSALIYLCWRWKARRVAILGLTLFLSVLFPFLAVFNNQYNGAPTYFSPDFMIDSRNGPTGQREFTNVAMKTHLRFGAYVVGVTFALLLDHLKKNGHKFTKIQARTGAFFGIVLVCLVNGYGSKFHSPEKRDNILENALYYAFQTQLVATGFMLLVIIQITNGLGILDSLFHVSGFLVGISRLSYWVCILNIPVFYFIVGSFKTVQHMTFHRMTYAGQYWGDLVLVYFIALYCHLIIDAPISHSIPYILNYVRRIQSPSRAKND